MRKFFKLIPLLLVLYFASGYQGQTGGLGIQKAQKKQVELKGEVLQPGVCETDWQASMQEVLKTCGGVKETADMDQVNLTKIPNNGDVIVIAAKKSYTCISINTADIETLDRLPGVGMKMAERIIQERLQQPFQTLEEIKRVKGIKEKTFEKMKDYICL